MRVDTRTRNTSRFFVGHPLIDIEVCSPFLVQAEGEGWRWQSALSLERVHLSSEAEGGWWWGDPAAQSHCGGDRSTVDDSW